jgi:hypothetical protein
MVINKLYRDKCLSHGRVYWAAVLFSVVLSWTLRASVAAADMACAGDAFHFCGAYIPDQTRVKSCLLQNISSLTPECRAQFREGRSIRARHKQS